MKIIIDAFGGDNAPVEIIKGAVEAVKLNNKISVILSGKADVIEQELKKYAYDTTRVEILAAEEVITNDETPTMAIRDKKESSLVKALMRLKEDDTVSAFVSAGSTGAVLTGAMLLVGRLEGISRPALAPILPTINNKQALLIDCGSNMDCKPEFLLQFAVMGSAYMSNVYGIKSPRIGLMSVGTEAEKGNALTKAAFELLKNSSLNFVGNMEARDALSGEYDVLVADGFVGNVALKTLEGAMGLIFTALKQSIMSSKMAKIGALLMKPALKKLKNRLDYTKMGGAPFLGCKKIVIKSHGAAVAHTITSTIMQADAMAEQDLVAKISAGLQNIANK